MLGSSDLISISIPVFLAALSGGARVLTIYIDHPTEFYDDKVQDLRKNRWGEVSAELGSVVVDVIETKENSEDDLVEDQPTEEASYAVILQKQYNNELLSDLESELDEYHEPLDHYQTCRRSVDKINSRLLVGFALAAVAALFSFTFIAIPEYRLISIPLIWGFTGLSIGALVQALRYWQDYRESREKLDEMWEAYAFTKDI